MARGTGDNQKRFDSETGELEDGTPLAFNRQPAEDLRPWLGRCFVAYVYANTNEEEFGELCNDASYLRSAVGADWTVGTAEGPLQIRDQTFLCGQHSKVWPLLYRGGNKVAGLLLRPGAIRALFGKDDAEFLDRIKPMEYVGIEDRELTGLFNLDLEPTEWLDALEEWMRDYITRTDAPEPNRISLAFETQAFADPNRQVSEFAEEWDISMRTLERTVRRDFGLTPKQVMRRARVLDFAARLCGVADAEEEEIVLRFFDQAHQIREFQAFFGVTPVEFREARNGLVTLSLEIRQARRLEQLNRIQPGAVRPWMSKPFTP